MAMRVVGGGERYVARTVASLNGVATKSVIVPAGADAARIQPQLVTNPTYSVLVARGDDDPTLTDNELILDDREVLMDTIPAGETIRFALVDSAGASQDGGANDSVAVVFYTNLAGRAQRKV